MSSNNQTNREEQIEKPFLPNYLKIPLVVGIYILLIAITGFLYMQSLRIYKKLNNENQTFIQYNKHKNQLDSISLKGKVFLTDSISTKDFNKIADDQYQRIKDLIEIRDKAQDRYESALENDISTLEMMLTLLALLIGFFAFVGVNKISDYNIDLRKLRSEYDTMIKNIDGNEVILIKMQETIFTELNKFKNPQFFSSPISYLYDYIIIGNSENKKININHNLLKGLYNYINGNFGQAEIDFNIYLSEFKDDKKSDNYIIAKFYYAMILDDNNKYSDAITEYQAVQDLSTTNILSHYALSNKAFTLLELARNVDENNERQNAYKTTLTAFEEADNLQNGNPINKGGLALTHKELKDKENANKYYHEYNYNVKETSKYESNYSKKQYERMLERINQYFRTDIDNEEKSK